jgi:hypothetical protein
MIAIGIDPGPDEHGVVAYDGIRIVRKANVKTCDVWEFVARFPDSTVACEMIESFGMPVGRSVFQTCLRIGQIYQQVGGCRLIPRRDVKLILCNSVRAKDANVRQSLIDRLGEVGTKKDPGPCYGMSSHLWPALGIAFAAYHFARTENEWEALA